MQNKSMQRYSYLCIYILVDYIIITYKAKVIIFQQDRWPMPITGIFHKYYTGPEYGVTTLKALITKNFK